SRSSLCTPCSLRTAPWSPPSTRPSTSPRPRAAPPRAWWWTPTTCGGTPTSSAPSSAPPRRTACSATRCATGICRSRRSPCTPAATWATATSTSPRSARCSRTPATPATSRSRSSTRTSGPPRPTKPRGSSPSGSSSWCCRTRERQDPPMTGTSPLREAWGLAIDLEDEYGTGPRATRRVQYASACTLSFGIPSCLRSVLEGDHGSRPLGHRGGGVHRGLDDRSVGREAPNREVLALRQERPCGVARGGLLEQHRRGDLRAAPEGVGDRRIGGAVAHHHQTCGRIGDRVLPVQHGRIDLVARQCGTCPVRGDQLVT